MRDKVIPEIYVMKKKVSIIIIILLLCGCTAQQEIETTFSSTQVPTENEQITIQEPDEPPVLTPTPETTPVPSIKSVALPAIASDNEQFLTPISIEGNPDFATEMETPIDSLISPEDDVFYVEFNEARGNNLQLNRPNMPTYIWHLNGTESETVGEVVIEFDLFETILPLHPGYFGYDRGFFVGIHNFDTIPVFPPWEPDYNSYFIEYGDTTREDILTFYEFAADMQKYVKRDFIQTTVGEKSYNREHIKINIPYREFQTSANNLTLQFYPGTTFGNLRVHIYGNDLLDQDIIDQIVIPIRMGTEEELLSAEILTTLLDEGESLSPLYLFENINLFWEKFDSLRGIVHPALNGSINPDGSISMPVSEYDLGEYSDEVKGKYAVIPEGLVPAFFNMVDGDLIDEQVTRQVFAFVFENMIDDNGEFSGIYDIEQGKMVARDRKVSALPILSAMLYKQNKGEAGNKILSNDEVDSIVNAIIGHDLVRIGDKLYYAPNGLNESGVMQLKLSDFAFSDQLLRLFGEYSYDHTRLNEEYGCAMLMEGFANSLELILEGQEQNPTRLPSSELRVIFSHNGEYRLEPSETFSIDNSYFSMGLACFELSWLYMNGFAMQDSNKYNDIMKSMGMDKNGEYSAKQEQYIREGEAMYAEFYNAHHIYNIYYLSCLNVANFIKAQPYSKIYAPGYNVNTGEMIYESDVQFYPEFQWISAFRERFGSPAVSANWFNLFGLINDEKRVPELARLTILNYDTYMNRMFGSQTYDCADPNLYTDNGLNMWGYDSLWYILNCGSGITAEQFTHFHFETSGNNMNREDWNDFIRRKLNELRRDDSQLTREDEIPIFFDHVPEIEIAD